jgi:hypothetical protein
MLWVDEVLRYYPVELVLEPRFEVVAARSRCFARFREALPQGESDEGIVRSACRAGARTDGGGYRATVKIANTSAVRCQREMDVGGFL